MTRPIPNRPTFCTDVKNEGDLNRPAGLLGVRDRHDIRHDQDASRIGGCKNRREQQQGFEKNVHFHPP
jgi:hypothetical protein